MTSPFDLHESPGLRRAVGWSIAIHALVVVAFIVVPRDWLSRPEKKESLMIISLGGTPGPRSTGVTSMGGRTVEQVAPPPRRAEPIRPTPREPVVPVPVPVRTPPAPTKPATTAKPAPPVTTRPPVTGPEITQGNTRVDTGARGQGAGLTFGGGGAGGETDLKDFCCPYYLEQISSTVTSNWRKDQPERGLTVIKFTIRRDGSVADPVVEQSSGSPILDRLSRDAVTYSRFLPLPAEYTRDTLVIHLRFPYSGSSR